MQKHIARSDFSNVFEWERALGQNCARVAMFKICEKVSKTPFDGNLRGICWKGNILS